LLGRPGHLHLEDLRPALFGDYFVPVLFSHILAINTIELFTPFSDLR
jgi:hypothetical protein